MTVMRIGKKNLARYTMWREKGEEKRREEDIISIRTWLYQK